MQTRSRSEPDKVVSYVEVDSDIDIDSEEEKLVSEFKGLSVKNNEGKKEARSKARKGRRAFTSKLLLDLPFDEFEVVCSHLEGRDLAHLVRVNKQLFNDLRGNSSIWREARKRDGYVLLDGMSEFGFGMLTWDDRYRSFISGYFLKSEFESTSEELYALESRAALSRNKLPTTASRRKGEAQAAPSTQIVDEFIKARVLHIAERQKSAEVNLKILQQFIRASYAARKAIRNARAEARAHEFKTKLQILIDNFGWTRKEVTDWRNEDWLKKFKIDSEGAIEASNTQRTAIQTEIARAKKESERWQRRWKRQEQFEAKLTPLYEVYRADAAKVAGFDIFPSDFDFLRLPGVRALSEPEDAVFTEESWREEGGGEAQSYPSDIYNHAFFSLATSALTYSVNGRLELGVYPEVFQPNHLGPYTNTYAIRSIRLMLEAARLDPATASLDDLKRKSAEGHWLWINSKDLALRTTPLDLETLHGKLKRVYTKAELKKIRLRYVSN
ncbi:hypothetical protein JCM3765_000161 [Sporobolomyces pararoseus]